MTRAMLMRAACSRLEKPATKRGRRLLQPCGKKMVTNRQTTASSPECGFVNGHQENRGFWWSSSANLARSGNVGLECVRDAWTVRVLLATPVCVAQTGGGHA
jgi:hypothetical protein